VTRQLSRTMTWAWAWACDGVRSPGWGPGAPVYMYYDVLAVRAWPPGLLPPTAGGFAAWQAHRYSPAGAPGRLNTSKYAVRPPRVAACSSSGVLAASRRTLFAVRRLPLHGCLPWWSLVAAPASQTLSVLGRAEPWRATGPFASLFGHVRWEGVLDGGVKGKAAKGFVNQRVILSVQLCT
jgi:hypothetical protein